MTSTSAGSSPGSPAGDRSDAHPSASPVESLPVPAYLLVEPMVQGKKVLDIATSVGGPGPECLRRAGAAEVISCAPSGPSLPAPDAAVDIVLCGLSLSAVRSDEERGAWLTEIRRVLRPDGFCMLRLAATAFREDAQAGAGMRAACSDLLLTYFATVDMVEQTQFGGVAFHVPGTDELAVNESLARLSGAAGHIVAFCTERPERSWSLSESLLVPTEASTDDGAGGGCVSAGELAAWQGEVARLEARCAELARERDSAREGAMTLQDRVDRLERAIAGLRKEVERTLRQMSNDAAGRELITLERDQLRRNLDEATQKGADISRELERRQIVLRALEKEVHRLRAARGGGGRPTGPAGKP